MNDEIYMREALLEAKKAFALGEVPVGAIAVYQNEIIARAHNRVETLFDATQHAEMICLKTAAEALNNWRLCDVTIYCTLEPCAMCAGAMILSRVSTLVWGACDHRHGAHGSWIDLFAKPHPIHRIDVRSGILKELSSELMIDFFRQRRQEK